MIPVAANDVAFSTHAVLATSTIVFQILIYDVSGVLLYLLVEDLYLGKSCWGLEY